MRCVKLSGQPIAFASDKQRFLTALMSDRQFMESPLVRPSEPERVRPRRLENLPSSSATTCVGSFVWEANKGRSHKVVASQSIYLSTADATSK